MKSEGKMHIFFVLENSVFSKNSACLSHSLLSASKR